MTRSTNPFIIIIIQSARDRGVILDSQLSQSAICRSGFISSDTSHQLFGHFKRCQDHCNSLLYGVPENLLRKVQSMQNAAARLLTNIERRDHITPVLCHLHETSGGQYCLRCASVTGIELRRRTSFDSSLSMVVVLSAHLPTGHSLFHGHAAVLATEALLLPDHKCGTFHSVPTNLRQTTTV